MSNLSPLTIPEQSSPTRSLSHLSPLPGPIGIFDSGYGGLTILHGIRQVLPQYDYLYLGDNARAPYGPRSFDVVYEFTRQAVLKLFEMGCQHRFGQGPAYHPAERYPADRPQPSCAWHYPPYG